MLLKVVPGWQWLVVMAALGIILVSAQSEFLFLGLIPGAILSYRFGLRGALFNQVVTALSHALGGNRVQVAGLIIYVTVGIVMGFMAETLHRQVEFWKGLTMIDPLTGMENRRYLQERLEAELNRACRQGTTLAVVILDLDGFKEVNDFQGHLEGDNILQQVAKALKAHVRQEDIAVRFGGDEFALVFPALEPSAVQSLLSRLGKVVEAETGLTFSVGVAVFPTDGHSPQGLLAAADQALLAAKRKKNYSA